MSKGHVVSKAQMVKVSKAQREAVELKVHVVSKVSKVILVSKAQMGVVELKVSKVFRVISAQKALKV